MRGGLVRAVRTVLPRPLRHMCSPAPAACCRWEGLRASTNQADRGVALFASPRARSFGAEGVCVCGALWNLGVCVCDTSMCAFERESWPFGVRPLINHQVCRAKQ